MNKGHDTRFYMIGGGVVGEVRYAVLEDFSMSDVRFNCSIASVLSTATCLSIVKVVYER